MNRRTALRAAFGVTAAAALGGALTRDASARCPGPRGVLRLATGEPTAFYAAFGRLLAAEAGAAYPGLRCRVRTTAGSITNIELLREAKPTWRSSSPTRPAPPRTAPSSRARCRCGRSDGSTRPISSSPSAPTRP